MAKSAAKLGHGSTATFNSKDIGELLSIGGPSQSRDMLDVSDMSSSKFREFIGGFIDAGEITLDINLTSNVLSAGSGVLDTVSPGTVASLVIKWASSTTPLVTFTCDAFVTGFDPNSSVGDKPSASITFKLTGKPTWA